MSRKPLGRVLEHKRLLQLCLSIEKSLVSVLEQFVILCDYSEIAWKCKGIVLFLDYRRNKYKIVLCLLSLSLCLYLCVLNLICCNQTLYQNLYTSNSDQVLTLRKRNHKKRTQFNPRSCVFLIFNICFTKLSLINVMEKIN